MSVTTMASLGVFCVLQVVAQVLFKWGSAVAGRWVWAFVGGNLLGLVSVWFLMLVYKAMNPNIALGLSCGISFLFSQIALAVVFKTGVSPVQWGGVVVIVIGIVLLATGKSGGV